MMKGHVIQVLRLTALLLVVLTGIILHARTAQADGDVWTSVGPDGGRIETIAVSPAFANDRTVFVGTATGVYKTTDGGTSWSAVNNGIDDRRVLSLAISPSYATDKAVFAGVAGSGGVYKSTDGGLNWRKVYYSAAPYSNVDSIGSLAVSPNYATDQTVFAGKSFYNGSMLLKSTDGGESWSAAGNGISGSSVRSLAISAAFATDRTIFAATPSGVFKSTDGSANWIAVNSGLYHNNVLSVAISSGFATDHTMYAITTIDPYYGGGIFKSTDGGANWSWVEGNYSISNKTVSGCTCLTLSPDYAVDQTVFVGTKDAGVFISRDGGYGFSQVDGVLDKNILTLSASPGYSTDKTAFAGTYANLLKSTDRGATWSPANNGIKELAFGPFAVSPNYAVDQTLITQANNVFKKTTDGGISWSEAPFGKGAYSLAYSPGFASDRTLFAGVMAGGVYKSGDGGATWVPAKSGIDQVSINSLAISPAVAADNTIFAGSLSNGVFKTTNGGGSWSGVSSGINGSGLYIKALALSPGYATDRTVFAGTNAGVYKSSNGGASWSAFNTGLVNTRITTLVISPGYVTDQTIFAGTEAGVFKSTDGGSSWSAFGSGIGSIAIGALAMSPGYAVDRIMYAGTSGSGVFKSVDGGQSWTSVNSGLVNLDISYLSYTNDRSVFAITSGGLFKLHDQSPTPVISVAPSPLAFGNVYIYTAPGVISATISNTGGADLAVSAITMTGADSAWFSLAPGTCASLTPTLAPGTSCTVNVSFAPTAIGARNATLQVDSNDAIKTSVSVPVNGLGVTTGPTVTSYQPANGDNAPISTTVQATFSEPLNPSSVTIDTFTLSRVIGAKAVAAGAYHTVALKNDGTVVAWGDNASGQTTVPVGLTGVTAIAAGGNHTVALKNDGTLAAWGSNGGGETTVPTGLTGVIAIAAGLHHTVALKNDGTVVAWGWNDFGQTTVPAGLTGITAIAAGVYHTVALKSDGTVVAWGWNYSGQITVPVGLTGVTAIAAGYHHTVALKNNGTVVAWGGGSGQTTVPAGLSGVTAIAAGDYHTVALKADGTVAAWGDNSSGQITIPAGLTGVTAVAAGRYHTVTLKNNGTLVALDVLGTNYYGQNMIPADLSPSGNVVSGTLTYDAASLTATFNPSSPLVSGVTYYAAVAGVRNLAGGVIATPVRWSFTTLDITLSVGPLAHDFGNVAVNATPGSRIVSITNAGTASMTVSSINLVGSDAGLFNVTTGTCMNLTPTIPGKSSCTINVIFAPTSMGTKSAALEIASNATTNPTASVSLTGSGVLSIPTVTGYQPANGTNGLTSTVEATFSEPMDPASITTDSFALFSLSGPAKAIAAGNHHTVGLTNDGKVVAWGENVYGQTSVPANLTGVTAIAAGLNHTVALKSDGTVVAWGGYSYSQNTAPSDLTGVTAIAAGYDYSVALKNNGTVIAWGTGQPTVPSGLTAVTAIAAGAYHTVALKSDGTVVAWGYNNYGQTTVLPGLTGVAAIAAGFEHTVALKSDGTVVAWGANYFGQTTVPAGLTGVIAIAAGSTYSVALKNDGTVVAWGYNDGSGQTTVPPGLTGVTAITAGGGHTLALKTDGTVVAWGYNGLGQTTLPTSLYASEVASAINGLVSYDPTMMTATFTPSSPFVRDFTYSATISAVRNLAGVPLASPVQWSFKAVDTTVSVTPSAYDFGNVVINSAPLTRTFILSNTSPAALTVNTITIAGTDAALFSLTPGTCTSLAPTIVPGGSCSVNVTFATTEIGPKGASMQIASNASTNPVVPIPLSGTGGVEYTLSITSIGTGSGTIAYSTGGSCAGNCSQPFFNGTAVTLTPSTDSSSVFSSWSGCDSVNGNQCIVSMTSAKNITASFLSVPKVTNHQPVNGISVLATTNVQATFSESIDPESITTGSFFLSLSAGIKGISAGGGHTVALKNDGTVSAWGDNSYGQASIPAGLSGVTSISAGERHTVALKSDSTVVAWGNNAYNQTTVSWWLTGVKAVAAGGRHTVALKTDGTVVAWGWNGYGQINVPGLSGVTAIAAGADHTVVLKNNGTVVAWGNNENGQSTVPTGLSGVTAIAAGYKHTVVLKNDGTVVAWGYNGSGQTTVPAGLSGVVAIAAGEAHTVALKNDGTVVAWGYNGSGQTTVPAGLSGVIAIDAGRSNTVALKSDGIPVAWGSYSNVPTELSSVEPGSLTYDPATLTAIFTPSSQLVNNMIYYACLSGVRSQAGVSLASPVRWSFKAVVTALAVTPAVHDYHNVIVNSVPAIKTFTLSNTSSLGLDVGAITLAGSDAGLFSVSPGTCQTLSPTIPANGSCTVIVSYAPTVTGGNIATLQIISNAIINPMINIPLTGVGVTSIPTVTSYLPANGASVLPNTAVLATFNEPVDIATVTPAHFTVSRSIGGATVAAGANHTVAITNDGSLVAWGSNDCGQTSIPTGLPGVIAVAAGGSHTLALKGDGTVAAWGGSCPDYEGGGTYTYGQSVVPYYLSRVTAIAAGYNHSVALQGDGKVVAWGSNSQGQSAVPAGLSGVIAIAAGNYHSVALKNDGTVVAWGYNSQGQSTVPAGLSGVIAVAAGSDYSLALKNDGTVVAWGYTSLVTVPADLSGVIAIAAGGGHSMALKNDGTIVAWGNNNQGQTTVPTNLSGITALAAGGSHSLVLKTDGTIVAWGYNVQGQTTVPADLNVSQPTVSGSISYDPITLTVTFTPSLPLLAGSTYYVTINGVRNPTGVPLSDPVSWSFQVVAPSLTVTLTGSGAGSVHSSPSPNINCFSGSCVRTYPQGTLVTLTATPVNGSVFTGWLGACTGSGQCQMTMNVGKMVTANFEPSGDSTSPVITDFIMPSSATTLNVPVTAFTGSDNVAVTGYLITESPMPPLTNAPGWTAAPPASVTFAAPGNCYAYAWARDAAGNVSTAAAAMVNITVIGPTDTAAPLITAFNLPSGTALTAPIATFAVTDNVGVGGYLISESGATPPASDPRWLGAPPASFTFTTYGNKTLYAWAKDAAGNVSARVGATCLLMDPEQQLDTVLTGWPANPAEASPSTFSFTASKGGTTFECSLDGQGYFACASPISFGALANGSHTFSVRAKDGVVYDDTPASYNWTVSIPIARVNLSTFTSITSAYAASSDGHSLELKGLDFREDLVFDRPISITLKGGYDPGYLSATGTTAIHGTLVISNGTVTVDNITIM